MYAYSAYCTEGLTNWTCWWCEKVPTLPPVTVVQVVYDSDTDTYGYIGYSETEIIVGFRGTNLESILNWITDFEFWQTTPYPNVTGAEVHYGWYTAYSNVQGIVVPVVTALRKSYPNLPIVTTGHSLGGALAILCAIDLIQQGIQQVQVVDFGQTRVGNEVFAQYFDQNVPCCRVVNQADLIPHYPTELFNYYHVATEVWFPSNVTDFVYCNGGEDPNCSDSVWFLSPGDHTTYLGFQQNEGHEHNCGN